MGNNKHIRTALAVVVAGASLFALTVGFADARGGSGSGGGTTATAGGGGTDTKQNVLLPATCDGGTAFGYAGYNKSGNTASIGFGMNADEMGLDWIVDFADNGVGFASDALAYPGTAWSVLENHVSDKGNHTITIVATNGAETCSASLTYKV